MIPGGFEAGDAAGLETLQLFAKAEKFNRWLYDEIAPYCKGAVQSPLRSIRAKTSPASR